jgi:hypothetical protein
MNTSPSTSTPDPEVLRKIAEEFQPGPSRIPFPTLKPYHEFIVMLRNKRASYRSVAGLLAKQGVKTSVARVAEYGRIVLDGGNRRKRRKYPHATQTAIQTVPPAPQTSPQISAPTSFQPTSKPERGPRIANVRMLKDKVVSNQTA